mmetsp:Transcript_18955/g.44138  ORF Transcript_18955/g.44138 Transcript_18955/m.44138 type:complete len:238 (+) Transcript_18955:2422-3135(+)
MLDSLQHAARCCKPDHIRGHTRFWIALTPCSLGSIASRRAWSRGAHGTVCPACSSCLCCKQVSDDILCAQRLSSPPISHTACRTRLHCASNPLQWLLHFYGELVQILPDSSNKGVSLHTCHLLLQCHISQHPVKYGWARLSISSGASIKCVHPIHHPFQTKVWLHLAEHAHALLGPELNLKPVDLFHHLLCLCWIGSCPRHPCKCRTQVIPEVWCTSVLLDIDASTKLLEYFSEIAI